MNNNINKQQLYAIEFLGINDEPLAYCNVEISINGYSLSDLPLQADQNGRWVFHPSLVEQEGEERLIKVVFWNDQYPKTEHSEVPAFTWLKGKKVARLRVYNIYEITPRTIPNEKGDPATYKRPYHIVKQGDTWEIIEKEAGINHYALQWENGLDDAVPLNTLVGQKIYFPKGTRNSKTKSKKATISSKSTPGDQQSNSKNRVEDKEVKKTNSSPKQPEKQVEDKKSEKTTKENKYNSVIQERSAHNDKPVDSVAYVSTCCCNRDVTLGEFTKIVKSKHAIEFLDYLNEYFRKYDINTCIGKAFFIANSLHESGEYKFLEEILPKGVQEKDVYDGYKGRGIMQLTWFDNYKGYGESVGESFLGDNKVRIAKEKKHAVGSGAWFWKKRGLNKYAINNDLITVSALINGGYNHFDERAKYYRLSINALNVRFCKNTEDKILSMLDNYLPFEDSEIYHNSNFIGECFGWGLWNDPGLSRAGKSKSSEEAKKGYMRFLEMAENKEYPFGYNKKKNKEKSRYGYSGTKAVNFAKDRLGKL
ncbi:LysM peptidoglycan-binding domain-containing protein [Aggregatibacter actinomycetemcomitans]|uniref:LysM peptidoglycan-binding domain-containing protein n=1 Tax=Aggregatibacter actinomycetemcomitans TaxID=714 RepID=UPI00197BBC3A|nr:LysM peptidoglycan-binding domain-containing protein [Aggregatibacter actinomycetemcomitans]MBN6070261.1 LysM peptidoglycan-binding domain-containing protein [Aggregatibacter actinomycetemcomitans]